MSESRYSTAAAAILVFAVVLLQGPGCAKAEEIQRFNQVKAWRLRVTWNASLDNSQVNNSRASASVETITLKGTLAGQVDFKLVRSRDSNNAYYMWETVDAEPATGNVGFNALARNHNRNKETGKEGWFSTEATAGGIGDSGARLTIDARAGTYGVGAYAASEQGSVTQSSSSGMSARSEGGVSLSTGPTDWQGALPAAGLAIASETRKLPCPVSFVLGGRTMDVAWQLTPWSKEKLPEVWVEPQEGFENWVPVGNVKDPEQPGNTFTVKAWVHDPDTPQGQAPKHKARIQFSLPKVSREPGVCMNWPPATKVKTGEGLRILEEENQGTLLVKSPVYAQSMGLVDQTRVVLSVFDYGAWGRLKVTAQDDLGHELAVRVRGREESELKIPVDENDNHIADAWETAKGVSGKPADADDETGPTEDNTHDGDGLTLYEEYRGFSVKGQHFSGDPQRKDLFICDHTAAKVAGPGINLFEKASRINVHQVDYKELGSSSRIINANHAREPHAVDQHGILIEDGLKGESPQQVPISDNEPFGSPKHTLFVQLPEGRKYKSGHSLVDVAHEIGHAVGLQHHGDYALYGVLWCWLSDSDGNWQMYEQKFDISSKPFKATGKPKPIEVFYEPKEGESTPRPLKHGEGLPPVGFDWSADLQGWMVQIYTQNGEWGGDVECFMRYEDKQAFFHKPDDGKRYLVDHSQDRERIKFCTSTAITYTNRKDHNPFSRGGETQSERGNCMSRIMINDAE